MKRAMLLITTCLISSIASGETLYISDILHVPLRSGAGSEYRIIHRGLKSGTPVELIEKDEESGFSNVRLENGMEGWLRSHYVLNTPTAKQLLVKAENRLVQMEKKQTALQAELQTSKQTNTQLKKENKQLTAKNTALSKELQQVKKISTDPIALDKKNQALLKKNTSLTNELDILQAENAQLKDDSDRDWFMVGTGTVILGIILGLIIPSLRAGRGKSAWV